MKPRLCIVGYQPVINIAKKVAMEFKDSAQFIFICALMEEALPLLREVEGVARIVLAGPSTRRMYAKTLKIPIISFQPTFPDLIKAIREAQKIDRRIAISLSRDDEDFNLPLLSDVMDVSLFALYCDNSKEYEDSCKTAKERGYKVIIGGSFTVEAAKKIGLQGILLYKGMDMIRTAIIKALEICYVEEENTRRISQLNAVVNNFTEGLLLTDEKGRVILDNPPAQRRLESKHLVGRTASQLFGSKTADHVLSSGQRVLNVLENHKLVVNYLPVRSNDTIHGLVCTVKGVEEVQDAEFTVRKRLHYRGFAAKYGMDDIIGQSEIISHCKKRAALYADAPDPILITGESGTGKELFAHGIHSSSKRSTGPFVAINCATLPNDLLESELFGYVKGAFTGAHETGKKGLIELAHKGTLFLDEITTLSYQLQAKLLRLLSEREILKLGSDRIIPIDVRILAATNENIEACVRERRFREDLYYRLNVFRLHIPPLRERFEDVVPLFLHFVSKINPEISARIASRRTIIGKALAGQVLKGNAREPENIARRFCLLYASEGKQRKVDDIIDACLEQEPLSAQRGDASMNLKTATQNTEKQLIQELIKNCRYKSDVAKLLGIAPSTLWRKVKKYDLR
ncbi:MAG: sigma 54-interacting transcriptional regulator [Deltaproteobacteria bacterium]|nr:sigma 54-interacting transcriptional regulator [Deltaproteobacteria bacterium]MBW2151713.1 sigma 54-interacting transcriptional regulator [Deltaproteobacteria bacterium]